MSETQTVRETRALYDHKLAEVTLQMPEAGWPLKKADWERIEGFPALVELGYNIGITAGMTRDHLLAYDAEWARRVLGAETGRPEVHEYFITFGVQYKANPITDDQRHPLGMHSEGYAVIEAPDREMARAIAFAIFDRQWAFDYDHKPEDQFAPAGELMRILWRWS